jgi:hypothetical protein
MAEQTITPEQIPTEPTPEEEAERLFHWQTWVHVGPGAKACDDVDEAAGTNDCGNPAHFHAWCHVPNQIEHERIREKAAAAKARRTRLLRDPDSDAYEILEGELGELERAGERVREDLVVELTASDRNREYREALTDVVELEVDAEGEEGAERPFEHIYDDQQRFRALADMSEEERPQDEYAALERHLNDFLRRVRQRQDERMQPILEAMRARDLTELIELVRLDRIRSEGEDVFMRTYSRHEWVLCTLRHPGGKRLFAELSALDGIAPEVYTALDDAYLDLERAQNEVLMAGNS